MSTLKSITALQPFLLLSKSATGRAAADLIVQATSAPDTFVFSELLECPTVAALKENSDGAQYHRLLELFAYGTWTDYQANTSEFPILNEAQERKLKQLSILSLCSAGPTCLTYSHVQSTLSIPNTRTLEDLIISLIYASLLTGKLDTKSQLIEVSSCAGRDVSPSDLPLMVATLSTWLNQCETAVGQIDQQLAKIRDEAVRKGKDNEDYEEAVNKKRESLMKQETVEMGDKGGKGLGKGKRVISDSAEDAAESKGRGSVWDDEDVEMKFGEGGYTGSGEGLGESNQSSRRTKTRFGGSLLGGSKRR